MTDLDTIRAAMAEAMHATDCACGAAMDVDHTPDVPEWYTELADVALRTVAPTLERLRAVIAGGNEMLTNANAEIRTLKADLAKCQDRPWQDARSGE